MKVIVYPNGVIGLHPEEPNEWIYTEPEPDHREFVPSITTRPDDQPNWHECTDAERRDWEAQHPDQEPEPEVSPDETGETPDGKGASDQPANEGKEAEV